MREILFRGKRLDNGEWVEGAYCSNVCDDSFTPMIEMPCIVELEFGFWYEVNPDTVSQYTGLCDKNGKKVFGGDIVRHYNRLDDDTAYDIGLIYYDATQCRFKRTAAPGEARVGEHCRYEVIGNVYDNPELLEG